MATKGKWAMKAITLWRPWAWAITDMGKDYENRTWECWLKPGEYLAIHAGKKWDSKGAVWIGERLGLMVPPDKFHVGQAIVGVARFSRNVTVSASPWFVGPVGWELYDVIPIKPVECPGKQGLWTVPADVLKQVRANWKAVTARTL